MRVGVAELVGGEPRSETADDVEVGAVKWKSECQSKSTSSRRRASLSFPHHTRIGVHSDWWLPLVSGSPRFAYQARSCSDWRDRPDRVPRFGQQQHGPGLRELGHAQVHLALARPQVAMLETDTLSLSLTSLDDRHQLALLLARHASTSERRNLRRPSGVVGDGSGPQTSRTDICPVHVALDRLGGAAPHAHEVALAELGIEVGPDRQSSGARGGSRRCSAISDERREHRRARLEILSPSQKLCRMRFVDPAT